MEEDYQFEQCHEVFEQKGAQAQNIIISTCFETIHQSIPELARALKCKMPSVRTPQRNILDSPSMHAWKHGTGLHLRAELVTQLAKKIFRALRAPSFWCT